MAIAKSTQAHVATEAKYEVTYEWRQALFGLLSWRQEVKAERISGLTLFAQLAEEPEHVVVNGVVYVKKLDKLSKDV